MVHGRSVQLYIWMLVVAGGAGLALTGAFAAIALSPHKAKRALAVFDRLDVRTAHPQPDGPAVLVTKAPLPEVRIAAGDGRRDGPPHWVARAHTPSIGVYAAMTVERRHGLLSSPVGLVDVSENLNARYAVTSDAPDAVRALFAETAVAVALDGIFADPACIDVVIASSGAVQVRFGLAATPDDLERAARLALSVARFIAAIVAAGHIAPVSVEVAALSARGASSASGVPVMVPIKAHFDGRGSA